MPALNLKPSLLSLRGWAQQQAADPDGQVLLSLISVGSLTALWALFWPVPTEVVGRAGW